MQLKCISDYRSAVGSYTKGQTIDLKEEEADFLLRDSPGSFEAVKPKTEKTATGIDAVDRRQRGGNIR